MHELTKNSEYFVDDSDAPIVYFTSDISAEGMLKIYKQLGWEPTGKVAVKLSTGEPPASYYLDPNLIKDVVQSSMGCAYGCYNRSSIICLRRRHYPSSEGLACRRNEHGVCRSVYDNGAINKNSKSGGTKDCSWNKKVCHI